MRYNYLQEVRHVHTAQNKDITLQRVLPQCVRASATFSYTWNEKQQSKLVVLMCHTVPQDIFKYDMASHLH